MKLLVVDYAEVESMWMGETPKNVAALFRSAAEQQDDEDVERAHRRSASGLAAASPAQISVRGYGR